MGEFTDSQDDVSKSLSQDRRRKANTVAKKGKAIEATRNLKNPLGPKEQLVSLVVDVFADVDGDA